MSDDPAPIIAGHTFMHSSAGWICERCRRRWSHVIARQPSWPDHDRETMGDPLSEGIACVGTLNDKEDEQIAAERQRLWTSIVDASGYGVPETMQSE